MSEVHPVRKDTVAAPSGGRHFNSGNGPVFQPLDIGHRRYVAVVEPDTAFWALVDKKRLGAVLTDPRWLAGYNRKAAFFRKEMQALRFGLQPSAVYFNPTERCNLNCRYCYIPAAMRRDGRHMSRARLMKALDILARHFDGAVPRGVKPQIVFHGAEPLMNRAAVFAGIDAFRDVFRFGVQTNGTLLDEPAIEFLKERGVGIGLSLDGPVPAVADRTRTTWDGKGAFDAVVRAMDRLRGYPGYNVIATVTTENLGHLDRLVDFFHAREVPACLLNIVRCTLPAARTVKPGDAAAARAFLRALDRSYALYRRTGRKLVVANFANVLVGIVAPTARRLMCDISPCGGGRCFFALAPNGDLFPCSEFIGLPAFRGGNLFRDPIPKVLASKAFRAVTGRRVEDIAPCRHCAIRHYCGAPCPAEAQEMNGGMERTGAFCEFYEEQVRYAFRLIADGRHDAYLWDGWDRGTRLTFQML